MHNLALWHSPPLQWNIEDREVHIWRASLGSLSRKQFAILWRTLASSEVERASNYRSRRDRERFVIARGTLRMLLGRYLSRDPQALRFVYNAYGKPFLEPSEDRLNLSFSLSHAEDLALFAIARDRAIGVDIERIRDGFDIEEIAKRFFSPRERSALDALPAERKVEAFFSAWTRKEAYVKARGRGFTLALDGFDVSLTLDVPIALLEMGDTPRYSQYWTLQSLWPGPGYVASIALEGRDWRVACWQWRSPSTEV
jgi:4'-phosphopantetheinyl transferase